MVLRLSEGIGNTQALVIETTPPPGVWVHIMGCIDASIGAIFPAAMFINGVSVGSVGQIGVIPFQQVPTNGESIVLGGSATEGFFTGDVCDLAIWFDREGTVTSIGSGAAYRQFLVDSHGLPVNPLIYTAGTQLGRPNALITGTVKVNQNGQSIVSAGRNPSENNQLTGMNFIGAVGGIQDSTSSPSQSA